MMNDNNEFEHRLDSKRCLKVSINEEWNCLRKVN